MNDKVTIEWHRAQNPVAQFVFAHGAGAGRDSEFMQDMASKLAGQGIDVALFDFEYMETAKAQNKKRPPDRAPKLLARYEQVLSQLDDALPIFIGGKSMGGRMASMLVCESASSIKGVLAFGYPFHPPGKPEKLRVEHFGDILCPFLILQGERDTFGNKAEVTALQLDATPEYFWLPDGDHSLKPRKASGLTEMQNRDAAAQKAVQFMRDINHG
ncbi:alpha/beta family hydrolase [Pseudoalteromonas sp. Of7M-16]|uniref:alpha/beta family hydrolase n=1 Tax=Pseudoalteromonas sp. Of7M-16 TaxID=2917756 RepID=UPI001EF53613|nr:alpha/beta family hydrolase [Pseudoalteromonas sp. Of7M-16]MCG7551501.1 dienelactone hydrolase family protein [Pseudoalteromonas sp. Of7M-16]